MKNNSDLFILCQYPASQQNKNKTKIEIIWWVQLDIYLFDETTHT